MLSELSSIKMRASDDPLTSMSLHRVKREFLFLINLRRLTIFNLFFRLCDRQSWLRDGIFSGSQIPNLDPRDSGSEFLNLGLEKIPKIPEPEIPFKNIRKNFTGFNGFLTIGIYSKFSENPWDLGFFVSLGIFSSLGIFIPRIRDFSKTRDFDPRDFS